MKDPLITINSRCWNDTWQGLQVRGKTERETVCVWAGARKRDQWFVTEVIFLDDFPNVEGFALFHRVPREAVALLFESLRKKGLELIADVHTHPEEWVGLSLTDKEHPLEYRVGFVSVVLPHYAAVEPALDDIGVHKYLGNLKWRELTLNEARSRIHITED